MASWDPHGIFILVDEHLIVRVSLYIRLYYVNSIVHDFSLSVIHLFIICFLFARWNWLRRSSIRMPVIIISIGDLVIMLILFIHICYVLEF